MEILVALGKKRTTKGDNLKGGLASNSWVLMRYCKMLCIAYSQTAKSWKCHTFAGPKVNWFYYVLFRKWCYHVQHLLRIYVILVSESIHVATQN